ncbi:hypothetical protein [Micromonospora halophytica]|uniref:PIN domain-containing protein n=1 Tax=Micromonospora halophytica TaxID=47864 RepID=A0A1C5HII4_9ACTN|nr:hypothetical protein [Micromonospora halophytica]SCG45836.1 hypothetical protein GA0070560_104255 [Micromonospora halophytica]
MSLSAQPTAVLVLDTMVLSHFTLADRLDVLQDLLIDADCWTTQVVVEELSTICCSRCWRSQPDGGRRPGAVHGEVR